MKNGAVVSFVMDWTLGIREFWRHFPYGRSRMLIRNKPMVPQRQVHGRWLQNHGVRVQLSHGHVAPFWKDQALVVWELGSRRSMALRVHFLPGSCLPLLGSSFRTARQNAFVLVEFCLTIPITVASCFSAARGLPASWCPRFRGQKIPHVHGRLLAHACGAYFPPGR